MEGYNSGIAKSDEQVAQLLSERPMGWEYLLYAGALRAGVDRLETKYMDYSIGYAPRLGIMIGRDDFLHFIQSQLSELKVMITGLNTMINNAGILEDALGPPGSSGDPDKILHAASRVIRIYEDILLWAERVRGMALPDAHREVAELLVEFSSQPVNALRDFVHRFGAKVNELPSRLARNETIVIEEKVTFTIPDGLVKSFNKKLEALLRDKS
jgi:hypothetical protein